MNDFNLSKFIFNLIEKIKKTFYQFLIGEVFISHYQRDNRSKLARIIDLILPIFIMNFFIFIVIFSYLNNLILSLVFCGLLSLLFIKSFKLVKTVFAYYLQGIYELKEKVNNIYQFINSLDENELENFCHKLLDQLKTSNGNPEVSKFNYSKDKMPLKVIYGVHTKEEELSLITAYKNELVSSKVYHSILVFNYPASKETIKLVKNYRSKSILNLIIIDINAIINMAITYENNVQSFRNKLKTTENKNNCSLDTFNQHLIFYKKKFYSHIAVASFLCIIGLILESFGSIYIILGFINILLSIMALNKYLNTINILIPGNFDTKLINNYLK